MVVQFGEVATAHQHPGTDIVSPVPIAQIPVAANSVVDPARVLSSADGRIAPLYTPEDHGLKAWTCDPFLLSTQIAGGSGQPLVSLLEVRDTMTVSSVAWWISTVGASPTSGQSRIGVWRLSDRALVAQTADVSGVVTALNAKSSALTATVTLPPGFYYVGLHCVASTRPSLAAAPAAVAQIGRTATNYRAGAASSTYTTAPPSTLPSLGVVTAAPWFALA